MTPDVEGVLESSSMDTKYRPVLNDEEQYSIWPTDRELPAGWREAGPVGSREETLEYIERTWTDMRPLTLREQLGAEPVPGSSTERLH